MNVGTTQVYLKWQLSEYTVFSIKMTSCLGIRIEYRNMHIAKLYAVIFKSTNLWEKLTHFQNNSTNERQAFNLHLHVKLLCIFLPLSFVLCHD